MFNGHSTVTMAEAVPVVIDRLAERQKDPEKFRGLKFGHPAMDKLTGGARSSELIVIAGAPNIGKTTWMISSAINFAKQVAINNQLFQETRWVGIVSLEEGIEQLVIKALANASNIETATFRDLKIEEEHWTIITHAGDQLAALPIVMNAVAGTIPELRKLHEKWNLRVNLIDYFTRMTATGYKQRWESHEYNATELKTLAKDYDCSEIALAHKTKTGNTVAERKRDMNELAGGVALSQEADMIIHILPCLEHGRELPNLREVYVAKSRNSGALESFDAVINTSYCRFGEPAFDLPDMPVPRNPLDWTR